MLCSFDRTRTFLLVLMAAVVPLACGDDPAGVGEDPPDEVTITMTPADEFAPPMATVDGGGTVTWVNQGDEPHTSTGDDWDSGAVQPGTTTRRRSIRPGRTSA